MGENPLKIRNHSGINRFQERQCIIKTVKVRGHSNLQKRIHFFFRFLRDLVYRIFGVSRVTTKNWEVILSDWSLRAKKAAREVMLIGCEEVLDIGAGRATLGECLVDYGFQGTYHPVDLHKRDERFGLLDLRDEVLPNLSYSLHAYIGVLEYIRNLDRVLRWSFANCERLLICYVPSNESSLFRLIFNRVHRWTLHWENNYSVNDLVVQVQKAGFEILTSEEDEFGIWITARKSA